MSEVEEEFQNDFFGKSMTYLRGRTVSLNSLFSSVTAKGNTSENKISNKAFSILKTILTWLRGLRE